MGAGQDALPLSPSVGGVVVDAFVGEVGSQRKEINNSRFHGLETTRIVASPDFVRATGIISITGTPITITTVTIDISFFSNLNFFFFFITIILKYSLFARQGSG